MAISPMITRVAAVQFAPGLGEVHRNLDVIEAMGADAVGRGATLVVAPECAVTGYVFETRTEALAVARSAGAAAETRMSRFARRYGATIVTGTLLTAEEALYNAAIIATPDGDIRRYAKTHLPFLGVDRFAQPGPEAPFVTQLPSGLRIGVLICYDLRFPEAARICGLDGADLLIIPTNWPVGVDFHPNLFAPARANENHCYLLAANRVGSERGVRFMGRSMLLDFDGNTIHEAGATDTQVLMGEVDIAAARRTHVTRSGGSHQWDTVLDRRPELYERLSMPAIDRSQ